MEGGEPTDVELGGSVAAGESTEGVLTFEGGLRESAFTTEVGVRAAEQGEEQKTSEPEAWQEKATSIQEPQLYLRPTGRVSVDEVDGRMGDSVSKGPLLCLGLVAASIAALLIVILVPLSFSDLEYYEVGI